MEKEIFPNLPPINVSKRTATPEPSPRNVTSRTTSLSKALQRHSRGSCPNLTGPPKEARSWSTKSNSPLFIKDKNDTARTVAHPRAKHYSSAPQALHRNSLVSSKSSDRILSRPSTASPMSTPGVNRKHMYTAIQSPRSSMQRGVFSDNRQTPRRRGMSEEYVPTKLFQRSRTFQGDIPEAAATNKEEAAMSADSFSRCIMWVTDVEEARKAFPIETITAPFAENPREVTPTCICVYSSD